MNGWQCKLVSENTWHDYVKCQSITYGTMWMMEEWWLALKAEGIKTYAEWHKAHPKNRPLSRFYFQHNFERRPPLCMWMPGHTTFLIDGCVTNKGGGVGWTVRGTPPIITVNPSINLEKIYHGWIKEGILSEDCEGRKFNVKSKS